MPRPRRPRRKPRPSVAVLLAAVKVMHERVQRCERACGLDRKPIGFDATAAIGDRVEQDEDDPEVEELP